MSEWIRKLVYKLFLSSFEKLKGVENLMRRGASPHP